MKSDEDKGWTHRKLSWLEALAKDYPTRGLAHDIGVMYATRYLNSESHDGWVGVNTLASQLGAARSSIMRALARLVEGGWLVRAQQGGSGWGDTNHYRLPTIIPQPQSSVGATGSAGTSKRVARTLRKGSADATRTPRRKPRRESREGAPPHSPQLSVERKQARTGSVQPMPAGRSGAVRNRKGGGREPLRSFPSNWEVGAAELHHAYSIAGWDANRAQQEFVRFRDYHRDEKDNRFRSWSVQWRRWCDDGRKYDEKHVPRSGRRETRHEKTVRVMRDLLAGEEGAGGRGDSDS
jgi:hypothetical protein